MFVCVCVCAENRSDGIRLAHVNLSMFVSNEQPCEPALSCRKRLAYWQFSGEAAKCICGPFCRQPTTVAAGKKLKPNVTHSGGLLQIIAMEQINLFRYRLFGNSEQFDPHKAAGDPPYSVRCMYLEQILNYLEKSNRETKNHWNYWMVVYLIDITKIFWI